MSIVILLICFVLIFLNLGILAGSRVNIKEILLKSALVFSAILVFITEFTSAFYLLNFQFILMSWIGISVLNIFYLFSKKEKLLNFTKILKQNINNNFSKLSKYEKYLSFSVIIILIFIFIQGLVYPPNSWDSMTYHMARITNWISHQSVAHYPTHIFRQLFQPPFSEFVIMHFNILNGGDYFSNAVQFLFLVFSLFAIVLIVELIGLSRQYQVIAVVLSVTIPEVILQASGTQNDIVISYFILTSFYFAVKAVIEVKFQTYFFLGLSIGLGILTKGTAYIYLAPILLIFSVVVLITLYETKNYAYISCLIVAVFMSISINSGHYIRNYKLTHNILGVDNSVIEKIPNEKMTPLLLLSSIIKNAELHLGPYPINKLSFKVIKKLHSVVGIDINNPNTNFISLKYGAPPNIPNHEDTASNSIHFYLIILSFFLIGLNIPKNKKGLNKMKLYLVVILLQVILFCLYLKWQPWHTRLHTPIFMLSVPIICYAISLNEKYFKILYKIIPIIIIAAFLIILINARRPFIENKYTEDISITDIRYKKYFTSRLNLYPEYSKVISTIDNNKYKNIGLILGADDWEYPIFSQYYNKKINPIHINVLNQSNKISVNFKNIDCIISTTINDTVIDFNGKRFYNQNSKNNVIWLYK